MGNVKIQKIIAGVTLGAFIFSTVLIPTNQAVAGVYDPTGIDLSQYKINNSRTTPSDQSSPETYLEDTNTYNLNIGTISESIRAVVGCSNIVNRVQKSLSDLLDSGEKVDTSVLGSTPKPDVSNSSSAPKVEGAKNSGSQGAEQGTDGFTGGSPNVPIVPDLVTSKNLGNTASNTAEQKKLEAQAKLRQECIDGVGYHLAKMQLAKMTQITVNWINSGFNGDPLYIRDRESYFQSIADGQLLNLVGPIASIENRYIYPFGRSVARSIINSQKSTYESRAQSTLNRSLQDGATTEDFANDFSKGGWDGWFSLTQNDQNNPLGFGIMTSQELADRTAEKTNNAIAELAEGKGFLSQKRCAEYEKESKYKASDVGDISGYAGNRTQDQDKTPRCIRYETVTPGSIIAEQTSTALTSDIRQLELADSMNESLDAVFTALVNQMIKQGLSSMSSFNPGNAPKTFGGEGSNKLYDSQGNDISKLGSSGPNGAVLSVNKGRGWYNANGTFDITTDLGDIKKVGKINGKTQWYVYKKGVISIQKDYGEAVKKSLKKLPEIMPKLGELDYCIPGPNANWESAAKDNINYIIEYLQGLYFNEGAAYVSWEDPLKLLPRDLLNVASPVLGLANEIRIFGKQKYDADKRKEYEDRWIAKEKTFEEDRKKAIISQKESFGWYKDRIDSLFGPESNMRTPGNPWYLPMAETGLQATKYIRVYDDNIKTATKDYKDLVNQTNANIYKLEQIKKKVDVIVNAAKARRKAKGTPVIDPSCYDMDPNLPQQAFNPKDAGGVAPGPGATVSGTQITDMNTGAPTGTAPAAGAVSEVTPKFDITIKENKLSCKATVTATNKTTGATTDISWGVKIGSNPTVYSKKTFNYENTFSTASQSGLANVTLTTKDKNGVLGSLTKSITIPKRSLNSLGIPCLQ